MGLRRHLPATLCVSAVFSQRQTPVAGNCSCARHRTSTAFRAGVCGSRWEVRLADWRWSHNQVRSLIGRSAPFDGQERPDRRAVSAPVLVAKGRMIRRGPSPATATTPVWTPSPSSQNPSCRQASFRPYSRGIPHRWISSNPPPKLVDSETGRQTQLRRRHLKGSDVDAVLRLN
jgi:hypothetical protein